MSFQGKDQFVHLHVHTSYSMLDGAAIIDELAEYVAEMGQPGFGISDHGNMHGVVEAYNAAKKYDLIFIPGMEAYMTPGGLHHSHKEPVFFGTRRADGGREEGGNDVSGKGTYTHMTLLAESQKGMHNLFDLSTRSYSEGMYRKPRISMEMLAEHSEGVIATTGCPSGDVQTYLRLGQYENARNYAGRMQEILGKDNYFLELMDHGMRSELERGVRPGLLQIAKELNIPLLATNDLHYTKKEDAKAHEAMLAMQTGAFLSEPPDWKGGRRFAFEGDSYYAKSAAEMARLFPEEDFPGALSNTLWIAERTQGIEFVEDASLRPSIDIPAGYTPEEWLRKETYDGLVKRYGESGITKEIEDRANYELDIIIQKDYVMYFLVVSDFVRWAKNNGVTVGPARGCLTGDTNILTPLGFTKLEELKEGDTVYDQNGHAVVIPNKLEYETDENLIEILTYYGGHGNKMTADHKVLISKAVREENKRKLAQGIRYKSEIAEPQWVRADEVEVGDLVVMPKLNFPVTTTEFKVEPVSVSQQNRRDGSPSRNGIANATGLSRSAVGRYLQNRTVSERTSTVLERYFTEHSLDKEEILEGGKTTSILTSDTLPANYDLGVLFGLFISDGWMRSRGDSTIGFAERKSEDEGFIPSVISKTLGITPTFADHAESDLRQYFIHHKGVKELFTNLFSDYEYTAHTKYIPYELFCTPEEFRRGLLDGLWYGDGTHKSRSVYSTVSPRLAQGVNNLLLSLGLPSSYKKSTRSEKRPEYNKSGKESYDYYTVTTVKNFDSSNMNRCNGFAYDGKYMYYRVRETRVVPGEGKVYDFTVPTTHSYVTDSGVVHNSGGGSLLAYALDITDIDPIRHKLLFERFLNPERDSPPDIDMDFDERNRERVIQYVTQKYGADRVAMIATFSKMGGKSALKDAARILEIPYNTSDRISKAYPDPIMGKNMALKDVYNPTAKRYDEAQDFRELIERENAREVYDIALGVDGRIRQTGVHAAGVIMSSRPIHTAIPLMTRQKDGATITQFDYPTCESLGLLKMDFLGLKNLNIIADTFDNIKKTKGEELNMLEIIDGPLDDKKTYELLQSGKTLGVFQLDGGGLQDLLRRMQPTTFDDISATIALYRPGPMGVNAHNDYADRKNGRQQVKPIHPELEEALEPILGESFGLVIYQEQIMQAAQDLAGYSLGRADMLRRAMGKKKAEVLAAEYVPFESGMLKNGFSKEAIKALWDVFVPFADYAFNRSHSAGYGLISYITAYLKANYPSEYMAALLTTADSTEKKEIYLAECKRMGINVLTPDVSLAHEGFTPIDDNTIMVGLASIRGVGEASAKGILAEAQENGPYKDISDFMSRAPKEALNKRVLEGLIDAGAFDQFGHTRRALQAVLPDAAKTYADERKKKDDLGQDSLFAAFEDMGVDLEAPVIKIPEIPEFSKKDKLSRERNALGLYVSDHPLSGMENSLKAYATDTVSQMLSGEIPPVEGFVGKDTKKNRIAGLISSMTVKRTKKGDQFAILRIEDLTGSIEAPLFPSSYQKFRDILFTDSIYSFVGVPRQRDEEEPITFMIDSLTEIEATDSGKIPMWFRLDESQCTEEGLLMLRDVLRKHPGETPIRLSIRTSRGITTMEASEELEVETSRELLLEVQEIFGIQCVGRWDRRSGD